MIIDLHCDTLNIMYKNNLDINNNITTLNKKNLNNHLLQVFALFLNEDYDKNKIFDMINLYYKNLGNNHVTKYNHIIKNYQKNKFSSLLSLEDGGYINSIEDLHEFYNYGVKIITLTWNKENNIGYPHTINKPLKDFGKVLIKEMENLNMIICVSHLSDLGFYDVYNNTTKPFIASHSNCRSICSHSRNLSDDMIKKINERKGLIGINFYNHFVSDKDITYSEDLIKHIIHIKNIASIDIISLGSDYDGIDNEVEFQNDINIFINKLKKYFSEEEIDKITYKNAAKFLKNFLN